MFRKSILALTAIAALGMTAAAPTAADAGWKKWKHYHHHHHYRHHRRGFGYFGPALVAGAILGSAIYASSCYQRRWVETPYGLRAVHVYVC